MLIMHKSLFIMTTNIQMTTRFFSILCLVFFVALQACKTDPDMPEDPGDPGDENPYNISVTAVESFAKGESVTLTGDISGGVVIDDLTWAAFSNVACFPATRAIEFEGSQVFYEVDIPQGSELIVTVNSTGADRKRINLYGYIDFNGKNVPPIQSILSCEAGYPLYVGTPDLSDAGEARSISFSQAVNDPFTALIAVSGAQGISSGTFELLFELK